MENAKPISELKEKYSQEEINAYLGWDVSHWSDWTSEVVGWESVPKPPKDTKTVISQTDPIVLHEIQTNTATYKTVKIQTDPIAEEDIPKPTEKVDYPPSLYDFFAKVTDKMCEEIRETIGAGPCAPEEYFMKKKSDTNIAELENLRKKGAEFSSALQSFTAEDEFEGRCLSWSPKGTQIAIGHCLFKHETWCRCRAVPVTIWSLLPSLMKKGPLHEIPFDGCVTQLEFHPKEGNYIAVGFYSGEIGLIDLNGDEKEPEIEDIRLLVSGTGADGGGDRKYPSKKTSSRFEFRHKEAFLIIDSDGHGQGIASLRWIKLDRKETEELAKKPQYPSQYFIVSTSKDGYIALWSMDQLNGRIFLERRYAILCSQIPDEYKSDNKGQLSHVKQLGIVSLDTFTNAGAPFQFVCSTFGSYLVYGTLNTDIEIDSECVYSSREEASKIFNTNPKFLSKEIDFVKKVSCSLFNTELFGYVTQSGNIRMRNVKHEDMGPIFQADLPFRSCALDIKWSLRPMLFGVISEKYVYIYDLKLNESSDVLRIENERSLRALSFSSSETGFLAVTDNLGWCNVWKLPNELTEYDFTEMEHLEKFAELRNFTAPICDLEDSTEEEHHVSQEDSN